ncbi:MULTISPECIES: glucuronate isomerase [unclassified Leifsonia]|uniref:glucuronate isomerase n=1 Tax=unclassified Leifsonia TaxID=2663824 RepID=UPI0008A80A51|nr:MULTISPECIES: glucuronate isomerase [unclassified Leifsonia]SEI04048.1 glucuronate isomerase [Leifsonia sp. CL154]SFL73945.1 glucuronate isomerase [Leifsonia sp. CL147]
MTALAPHPDRLLPADPGVRELARRLYSAVATAPILSPHGHVDARLLADDEPFPDPAALLITPDHYVTRMLHAVGVPLDQLGVSRHGVPSPVSGRAVWRTLCEHWDAFLGTPVRFWFESEFSEVFGLAEQPSARNADALYDQLAETLARPEFRPRALFGRFGIEVLATTDDPADDLEAHARLAADPSFRGRVLPTFRADRYMHPDEPGWADRLERLAARADVDTRSHAGLLEALRARRRAFAEAGGTATDTGVRDAGSEPLAPAEAERIHRAALSGSLTAAEAVAYRRDLLYRLAEMSASDGLVMQLHPGVIRNHHRPTFDAYGPDTGHDLPAVGAFTEPLTPILRDFGTNPAFRLVLFTVDETVFSREIAPLAGFYPSVYAGAPWWFLDTPSAIRRYREAVTDSAGFTKTSGFIDDTRAFCSIPARHDMSRRVDAGYLANLVATHQLSEEEALAVAKRFVDDIPRATFRLG